MCKDTILAILLLISGVMLVITSHILIREARTECKVYPSVELIPNASFSAQLKYMKGGEI